MSEALQRKLLVDTQVEDYLRAVAPAPGVPANWKPGFLSSDKPWGSLEEARALLAGGRITEGRELLRRLAKHTADPAARAVFARELMRPPQDLKLARAYLGELATDSSEFNSLRAVSAFDDLDYGVGGESFAKASDVWPASIYGCAFLFEAFIRWSDLHFQTRLLLPRKREMEGAVVLKLVKGAIQLSLRMHKDAWTSFKLGWLQAGEHAKGYEKALELEMTAEEIKLIETRMGMMCAAGLGLVLFDLGLRRDAAQIFDALARTLEGSLQHAAQVLARA